MDKAINLQTKETLGQRAEQIKVALNEILVNPGLVVRPITVLLSE